MLRGQQGPVALAKDGPAAHHLAWGASAVVRLDAGWNCARVAAALLLDGDTIRQWHDLLVGDGPDELASSGAGGRAGQRPVNPGKIAAHCLEKPAWADKICNKAKQSRLAGSLPEAGGGMTPAGFKRITY